MTREERTKLIKHLKYNRSIGADYLITDKDADEIIKALEQEPKQVELEGDGYAYGTDELVYDFGKCPTCGWVFEEGDKDWEEPYCCHCGQKLKWFDGTEANE